VWAENVLRQQRRRRFAGAGWAVHGSAAAAINQAHVGEYTAGAATKLHQRYVRKARHTLAPTPSVPPVMSQPLFAIITAVWRAGDGSKAAAVLQAATRRHDEQALEFSLPNMHGADHIQHGRLLYGMLIATAGWRRELRSRLGRNARVLARRDQAYKLGPSGRS
jgi:hypothetical protein